MSLTIAVKQQETKQPRMHHSSPNVDQSVHTERGTYGQQYINISPPPPMTDTTLSASTRTPVQVVNSHKSGLSGHYAAQR